MSAQYAGFNFGWVLRLCRHADHQTRRIPTADGTEAALIAGAGNKLSQNIVCTVSLRAALVNRIDNEVGGCQRGEWKYLGHCSKADFAQTNYFVRRNGADLPREAVRPADLALPPNSPEPYRA